MNARYPLCLAALLAGTLAFWSASPAVAEDAKARSKVFLLNGKPIVAEDVVDLGNEYELTEIFVGSSGKESRIKRKIPKTQVTKVEALGAAKADAGGNAAGGFRAPITDAIIQEILGSDNIDISMLDTEDSAKVDVMAPLDTDQTSVNDMLRIAGTKAKTLATPHFVFVYTSDLALAQEMASKLERVYRWVVIFNEQMGIKSVRPRHKLEIFFFGHHREYMAYQALTGGISLGAIGFFQPLNNRSAFFNMLTWPPVADLMEQLKQPGIDPQRKREIENRITRKMEHLNREVVQHEASHHIHFNTGTFVSLRTSPRWAVEGMAQMFEVVESDEGASLGALNHSRLYEFRQIYGQNAERLPDLRVVMFGDRWWFANGAAAYPLGWALNQFLRNQHRDQFKKWMQLNSSRDDRDDDGATDRQLQFEELFGPVNDEWTQKFAKYMNSLVLKRSAFVADEP